MKKLLIFLPTAPFSATGIKGHMQCENCLGLDGATVLHQEIIRKRSDAYFDSEKFSVCPFLSARAPTSPSIKFIMTTSRVSRGFLYEIRNSFVRNDQLQQNPAFFPEKNIYYTKNPGK